MFYLCVIINNKKVSNKEINTEQKIKEAARVIFQQKGFEGTKTRDIADKAGINLALLNYYFRSKKKLFDIIMMETMQTFFAGVISILENEATSIDEKLEEVVKHYLGLLTDYPNIGHFIMNSARNNPEAYIKRAGVLERAKGSFFFKQFSQAVMDGKVPPINPLHLLMNIFSLIIFPFLVKSLIVQVAEQDERAFAAIIEERKRLIPLWIKEMLKVR